MEIGLCNKWTVNNKHKILKSICQWNWLLSTFIWIDMLIVLKDNKNYTTIQLCYYALHKYYLQAKLFVFVVNIVDPNT